MEKALIAADIARTVMALAEVEKDIDSYGSRTCVAVVRLHDRRHDLEARRDMLVRKLSACK